MNTACTFLAISVAAMDDLDWLYKAADSELGLMSPCGLMLDRARWGMQGVEFSTEDACPEEARLEALELVRNVRELLLRIAERHSTTLERLHQPRQWPMALVAAFGVAAPLASRTSAARAAYKRETGETVARSEAVAWWLEQLVGRSKRDDKLLVRAIACEARRAREEAYEAYETARALVTFAQPGGRRKRYPSTAGRGVVLRRQVQHQVDAMNAERAVELTVRSHGDRVA